MKRLLTTLAIVSALVMPGVAVTGQVAAAGAFGGFCSSQSGSNTHVCKSAAAGSGNPIINILKAAIDVVSLLTGALAVIFIIIAGLRFVTSSGSSEGVAQARNALLYAMVGIAVTLLAQSIVIFVLDNVN